MRAAKSGLSAMEFNQDSSSDQVEAFPATSKISPPRSPRHMIELELAS